MTFKDLRTIVVLAVLDFHHERRMSLCHVLGLSSVLAPLMVLFGMKYGVITTMTRNLQENPRTLELRQTGQGRFDAAWLKRLANHPATGFVIANTRTLSATITLTNDHEDDASLVEAEMIPSASGDPLLGDIVTIPTGYDQLVLTTRAAEKLRATVGSRISGRIGRIRDGQRESKLLELTVVGILPLARFQRQGAFLSLPLLLAAEDYREGYAVPALKWPGGSRPIEKRFYAGFRLYAKQMEDVTPLSDWLAKQRIETLTKAGEIATLKRMDMSLTLLFLVVAGMAGSGYVISMAANLWATVMRKQRELSVLKLMGFPRRLVALFPMTQASLVALFGWLLAAMMYALSERVLNTLFDVRINPDEVICQLLPEHYFIALAVTWIVALLAAAFSGMQAGALPPAQGLRME